MSYSINRFHLFNSSMGTQSSHSLIYRNHSWDDAMEYLTGLCQKAATRGFVVTNTEFGKFSCMRDAEMFIFEIVVD